MNVEDFIHWCAYACVEIELTMTLDALDGAGICANPHYNLQAESMVTGHSISVGSPSLNDAIKTVVQYMRTNAGATDTIPVPS